MADWPVGEKQEMNETSKGAECTNEDKPDNRFNDFRDLDAWKNRCELRRQIWVLCKEFPRDEGHRLIDQMIRTSRSAAANIAEGYGQFHYQESIQFCRQDRGSLYELIDHVRPAVTKGSIK